MKAWRIPVVWQECGVVTVEASTLEEAIEVARDKEGAIHLPQDGYYVDGSWDVACADVEYLRSCYNDFQSDAVAGEEGEDVDAEHH